MWTNKGKGKGCEVSSFNLFLCLVPFEISEKERRKGDRDEKRRRTTRDVVLLRLPPS